jgi:hypothetical protein
MYGFEPSQYEPGHLSQADACNIQDSDTVTDQMLSYVEQRDETAVLLKTSAFFRCQKVLPLPIKWAMSDIVYVNVLRRSRRI